MALRPEHYGDGEDEHEGDDQDEEDADDAWNVCGEFYREHPRRRVGEEEAVMLEVWRWSRGTMGSVGHLPELGGTLEQPAKIMDAIGVMNGTADWCDEFLPKPKRAAETPPRRARRR